jgi:hypothetical protein
LRPRKPVLGALIAKPQKTSLGWLGYPKEPEFQNSEYAGHQVGPTLQSSRSYGLGCRRGTNFCPRWRQRRRRVTDGKKFIAFFHVLWLFIGEKHDLSKKNSKFLGWNQYFPLYISSMRKKHSVWHAALPELPVLPALPSGRWSKFVWTISQLS